MRRSVAEALADGSRGVTAKIRWLTTATASLDSDQVEEGRPRWIHCTPLLGQSGTVGVWMVVLVDDEKQTSASRRFRPAPPVPTDLYRPPTSFGSSPDRSGLDSDGDRDPRRSRQSFPSGGPPRNMIAVGEQRAEPSINSFAL